MLNLVIELGGVQVKHIIHPAAFDAADVRMLRYIGVIAEAVLAGVQDLNQADLVQDIDGLVDGGQAHRGVGRLQAVENHFGVGVFLGVGQRLINGQSLRCHLETIAAE